MEVFVFTFILMFVIFAVLMVNRFVHQKGRHALADQKKRGRKMKRVGSYPDNYKVKF